MTKDAVRPRLRPAVAVGFARLRSQPVRALLVVVGVGVSFATLVGVAGESLSARQVALRQAVSALPPSQRTFRVDRFGLPLDNAGYARADAGVRRAIAPLSDAGAQRVVFFRELHFGDRSVAFAAVDDPARLIRLRQGRRPRQCAAATCEMIAIGGAAPRALTDGSLRIRVVGRGELRDPTLFSYVSDSAVGLRKPVLLVAPSVRAIQRIADLTTFYRVYSWLLPVSTARLRTWDVSMLLQRESRAQARLEQVDPAFRLSGPDQAVTDADDRGRIAGERLALIGGELSALILGFAMVAAVGLRRGLAAERRRLAARGARRWQSACATGTELVGMTVVGASLGIGAGALAVAALAGRDGLGAGDLVAHTLFTRAGAIALPAALAVSAATLAVAASGGEGETTHRFRVVDAAALGALLTLVVAVSRGAVDPQNLSSGNALPLLLLLPALCAFVFAVALARLFLPLMRLAERATRNRSPRVRVAVLALSRAPARTVTSCAFVAVALALCLFAIGYRSTLLRGLADEAAFQVPVDFVVGEGSKLVEPLDVAPAAGFAARAPGTSAFPVSRVGATTPGRGATVLAPTVLALPPRALQTMRWRSDDAQVPRREIGRRLTAGAPTERVVHLRRPSLVRLVASATHVAVVASLVMRDGRGRVASFRLGRIDSRPTELQARVPAGDLLSLRLALTPDEQFFFAHRETEGTVSAPPAGRVALGLLRGGRTLVDWSDWETTSGAVTPAAGGASVDFTFADPSAGVILRPRQATDGMPMPVLASPEIAAAAGGPGGVIALDFGDAVVQARVVAVGVRFPTIPSSSGPFVVADRSWLETTIDATAPGEASAREIWITTKARERLAAELQRGRFAALDVQSHSAVEHALTADPLRKATSDTLLAGAIAALVLALVGFVIGIVSEIRDERSDFYDLEVQGLAPASLRAQLRIRSTILISIAVAAAIALAAVLLQLVVATVRVSGGAQTPEPPLRLVAGVTVATLVVVALVALALVAGDLCARLAFRSDRPERVSWSLE